MDITVTLTEHHVWLVGELLDSAERYRHVLDEPVGAPTDRQTVRGLLGLMVGQLEMWLDLVDGKPGSEQDDTLDELRRRHDDAGPRFVELTRRVVAEGIAHEQFRDGTADHPGVFTYGGAIAHVLTFGAHHRALVIGALQAAGATHLRYGDPMLFVAERVNA